MTDTTLPKTEWLAALVGPDPPTTTSCRLFLRLCLMLSLGTRSATTVVKTAGSWPAVSFHALAEFSYASVRMWFAAALFAKATPTSSTAP
jgi:hypothetical protein